MERLTEYRDGIATARPELYMDAVKAGIPEQNWNNYVIKRLCEKLAIYEDKEEHDE